MRKLKKTENTNPQKFEFTTSDKVAPKHFILCLWVNNIFILWRKKAVKTLLKNRGLSFMESGSFGSSGEFCVWHYCYHGGCVLTVSLKTVNVIRRTIANQVARIHRQALSFFLSLLYFWNHQLSIALQVPQLKNQTWKHALESGLPVIAPHSFCSIFDVPS